MIQKFAKTAPSIPSCVGGPFLQIFGSLYFVKYVLKKTGFSKSLIYHLIKVKAVVEERHRSIADQRLHMFLYSKTIETIKFKLFWNYPVTCLLILTKNSCFIFTLFREDRSSDAHCPFLHVGHKPWCVCFDVWIVCQWHVQFPWYHPHLSSFE